MNDHARRIVQVFPIACAYFVLCIGARAQAPAPPPAAGSAMPSVDQILNHYVEAQGGRAAWQKLTSRVTIGTIEVPSMQLSGTIEFHEKAPDRFLGVVTINGASFRQGYDGTAGWTDDPANGMRDQTGPELAETRRESDFYHSIELRKLYSKLTLTGKEKIGERDAYVIEADLPEGGEPDKLYFDVQTGLALRVTSQRHGPDGVSHIREDLEDYREVDGVKLPFIIRQTNGDTVETITIGEYHHNVPLEDGQFAKPAAQ